MVAELDWRRRRGGGFEDMFVPVRECVIDNVFSFLPFMSFNIF